MQHKHDVILRSREYTEVLKEFWFKTLNNDRGWQLSEIATSLPASRGSCWDAWGWLLNKSSWESQRGFRVPAAWVCCRKWQKLRVSLLPPMMASTSTSCRGRQHLSTSYWRESAVMLVTLTTCLTQELAFLLLRHYIWAAKGWSWPQFGISLARKQRHFSTAVQETSLLQHSVKPACCWVPFLYLSRQMVELY